MVLPRPLLNQSCLPVFGSYAANRFGKFTINSSRPSALTIIGVLQDPSGLPPPPRPPGPPPGPRPPGPPPPPNCGRGSAAFNPSRSLFSSSEPDLSLSHSTNHFANVAFSSSRVVEPSLLVSAAAN